MPALVEKVFATVGFGGWGLKGGRFFFFFSLGHHVIVVGGGTACATDNGGVVVAGKEAGTLRLALDGAGNDWQKFNGLAK